MPRMLMQDVDAADVERRNEKIPYVAPCAERQLLKRPCIRINPSNTRAATTTTTTTTMITGVVVKAS
jgi:hypothetical protein